MIGAYIAVVLGVAVWSLMTLVGRKVPDGIMRGITVFGGAFLLGVCVLGLLPEATEGTSRLPFFCVLAGFLIQQLLEALSAHAEHGHVEDHHNHGVPVLGLMLGQNVLGSDGWAAGLGVALLGAGFLIVRLIDRRLGGKPGWKPKLVRVVEGPEAPASVRTCE